MMYVVSFEIVIFGLGRLELESCSAAGNIEDIGASKTIRTGNLRV